MGGVCGCLTLRRAVPLDTLVSAGVNAREVAVRGGGEPRQDEERRRRGTARPPLVVSPRQLRKLTLKRAQVAETVRACLHQTSTGAEVQGRERTVRRDRLA